MNVVPGSVDHLQRTPPLSQAVPTIVFGNAAPSVSQYLWPSQTSATAPPHINTPSYDHQHNQSEVLAQPSTVTSCESVFMNSHFQTQPGFPNGATTTSFMSLQGMIQDQKIDATPVDVALTSVDGNRSLPPDLESFDEQELLKLLEDAQFARTVVAHEHRQTAMVESLPLNGVLHTDAATVALSNPSYQGAVATTDPDQMVFPDAFNAARSQTERTQSGISLGADASDFDRFFHDLNKHMTN
jgi:hypothetical protein